MKAGGPRKRTDWEEVRARLARATAAAGSAPTPAEARAILEQRARALARVPAQAPAAGDVLEVVRFSLSGEHYAVETRHVCEVLRLADYTPVPGAPDFLLGVINLRGEVLAVIDLRRLFGLAGEGITPQSRVLVLGGGRAEFGVLADAAEEVTTLRADEVHEPPGSVAGVGRDYLRGVTAEALLLLDGALLLRDARLTIDQAD